MKVVLKNILKNSSLLLVNDDLELRANLYKLLECYTGKIYEASDGIEAINMYKDNNPSFIITDIRMPNMNGLEFIQNIRAHDQKTPIVIFSAYTDTQYLLDAVKLNLVDYLVAPIVYDKLIKTLEVTAINLRDNKLLEPIELDACTYDPVNKIVVIGETINHLTTSESKLLELLIMHKGNLVTKHMVEDELYQYKMMSDASLKNIVFKIRKKLPPNLIVTVENLGYRIGGN